MSIDTLTRDIQKLEDEIADLSRKSAAQSKSESSEEEKIAQIRRSINKNTSSSVLRSKQNEIDSHDKRRLDAIKKRSDFDSKASGKRTDLAKKRKQLSDEEARERVAEKRKLASQRTRYEQMMQEIRLDMARKQVITTPALVADPATPKRSKIEFDVFISHASEDKEEFVEPLYQALKAIGITSFYDKESIPWGGSIREKVDSGLSHSKMGIVVISKFFCAKKWTSDELNALFALETKESKIILPIWHDISKSEVLAFSPMLADRNALKTSDYTVDEIAEKVKRVIYPPEEK